MKRILKSRALSMLLLFVLVVTVVAGMAVPALAANDCDVYIYVSGQYKATIQKPIGYVLTRGEFIGSYGITNHYTMTVGGQTVDSWGILGTPTTLRFVLDNSRHDRTTVVETTPATCTATGLRTITCSCGYVYTETIPMSSHTKGEEVKENILNATCTVAGSYESVYYCTGCGTEMERTTVAIPAAHTEEIIPSKAATCTETGLTEGKKCSVCGNILVAQTEIAKLPHTEEVLPGKAATCTETGLTEGKKCSVCGGTLVAQTEIAKLAHTEEAIPGKAATCTEAGLTEGKKCSVCGEITVAQTTIDALGHIETTVSAVAATCTQTGLTEGKKCAICHTILLAQQTIDKLPHKGETVFGKAATCTEDGLTDGTKCSVCSAVLVKQDVIPATGHTSETLPAKEPTCTEAGLTAGGKCSVCNAILGAQQPVDALGHDWQDATCTASKTCARCNATEGQALGHTPGTAVTENLDLDCVKGDSWDEVVYCTVCKRELSREAKQGPYGGKHTATAAVQENRVESTCADKGSYDSVVYCKDCGKEISRDKKTLPLLKHTDADKDNVCDVCTKDIPKTTTASKYYGTSDNPKTDDPSNMVLWLVLVAVGLCGMGGSVILGKRRA